MALFLGSKNIKFLVLVPCISQTWQRQLCWAFIWLIGGKPLFVPCPSYFLINVYNIVENWILHSRKQARMLSKEGNWIPNHNNSVVACLLKIWFVLCRITPQRWKNIHHTHNGRVSLVAGVKLMQSCILFFFCKIGILASLCFFG